MAADADPAEVAGLDDGCPLARSLGLLASWSGGFDEMCASFSVLGDEGVWDQRPIPRIRGTRRATAFPRVARTLMGLDAIHVEVLKVASSGDVVHTQRVDRLLRRDGTVLAEAEVAGVLVWNDDRLVYWREHFDAASLIASVLARSVSHATRRFRA